MLKIKKGDTVKVIAGKDKDKEGKVIAVNAKKNTVTVEGINTVSYTHLVSLLAAYIINYPLSKHLKKSKNPMYL